MLAATPVRAPFGDLRLAKSIRRLLLLFQPGSLNLFGLFKPKEKLVFGKRLGPAAEAMTLQFLDDLMQAGILCLARKHHGFQRVQVIRKLVCRHRHGLRTAYFAARNERLDDADSIGRGRYPAFTGMRVSLGACTRFQSNPSNKAEN